MHLTRRMTGLHKEPAHWYLDVGGRRAGPYDWTVILELARSGGLGWDDLLWCPEFTAWKPAAAFPELAAVLASETRPRTDPIGPEPLGNAQRRVPRWWRWDENRAKGPRYPTRRHPQEGISVIPRS